MGKAQSPQAFTREQYYPKKLDELIVYVARNSANDPNFSMTKLNTILFFSDFQAYRKFGKPITGAIYWRLPQGPCPHQVLPALRQLSSDVELREDPTLVGVRTRPMALRPADMSNFDASEISMVDTVLNSLRDLSVDEASELSRQHLGWKLPEDRQEIPYASAICASVELDQDILDWLKETTQEVGLVDATPR